MPGRRKTKSPLQFITWQPVSFLRGALPGVQRQTKHAFLLRVIIFVCSLHLGPSKQTNKQTEKKKNRQRQMKERSFVVLGNVPCAAGRNTLVSLCQKRWTHRSQHALQSGEQWRPRKKKAAAGQRVGAPPQPGDSDPADPLLGWKPALCCCIDLSGGGIVHDLGESHRCPVACWP